MPRLEWVGKDKVIRHHEEVPLRTLDRQYSFDENGRSVVDNASQNMLIHGDNLEALKALMPKYAGKITCIYIDPPYNTGNESWVYNDNVNDPKLKKWLGKVVGKEGEDLSRHDKWLCMMYPRLKLLQALLADDGVIFISIDANEKSLLKTICDEIFGLQHFVSEIAVINNLKGRSDGKFIATAHESLLIYQKGQFVSHGVAVPEHYQKEYRLSDEQGKYRLLGLRKRGSNARAVDRPNLFYPVYCDPSTQTLSLVPFDGAVEIVPRLSNGEDGTWRWCKETLMQRVDEVVVKIVKTRNAYDLFQKDYLPEDGSKRIKPKSFWMGSEFSAEAGTLELKKILGQGVFATPKPSDMIAYCIEQTAHRDAIILDAFAGSGTTAHAVLKMNRVDGQRRRFILIEMEDYAESIMAERVKRVICGYDAEGTAVKGTGGDFSFFALGKLCVDAANTVGALPQTPPKT